MKTILKPYHRFFTIFGAFALLLITSCNKTFEEPPLNADPDLPVTMTIAELKNLYTAIGDFKKVEEDKVVSGIVTADDRTGNFYSQIVIQDETGGIPVLIDRSNLYTTYPVGRRVYLKVKGMMLGDYGGTIQIGYDSSRSSSGYLNVGRIPSGMTDQFIIKGSFGNVVTPQIVKPSEFTGTIHDPLMSRFVQINNAEFRDADLAKTYADPDNKASVSAVNFTIKPCDDTKSITLRNSSYASFAGLKVPQGNGPLLGIASVFSKTIQIMLRDTSDVQFYGTRCSGQAPVETLKTIAELLQYATADSTIPAGIYVEGILVSDTKNESAGNYRLQQGSAGVQIRFAKNANPNPGALGDKVKVYVGGYRFSIYNGGLQIDGPDMATTTGTGTVTPRVATVAEIAANMRAWESTVVTIKNVEIAGSGSNYTITDASGQITTYVRSTSGIVMPTKSEAITGYVSVYKPANGDAVAQLVLRTQADIEGGTSTPPEFGPFTATYDFAAVTTTSGTTDPTPPPTVSKLTFSNVMAVGVGANSSGGGRFSFNSWPLGASNGSDAFTGSIDPDKYYEITITPAGGAKLDLTALALTLQRSGTGVRQAVIRSSVDNFGSNLTAAINPANANLTVVNPNIFQWTNDNTTTAQTGATISFGASHTGLAGPVKIRIYGLNAEQSGGTFSIDNVTISGTTKQ